MTSAGSRASTDEDVGLERLLGPVQRTCYDAWLSKCLAARCGFFEDAYIALLDPIQRLAADSATSCPQGRGERQRLPCQHGGLSAAISDGSQRHASIPTVDRGGKPSGSSAPHPGRGKAFREAAGPDFASSPYSACGDVDDGEGTCLNAAGHQTLVGGQRNGHNGAGTAQLLSLGLRVPRSLRVNSSGLDAVLLHGTYARVMALRHIMDTVLERLRLKAGASHQPPMLQLLSLGAGLDSMPFWLLERSRQASVAASSSYREVPLPQVRYHELDTEQVASLKALCIRRQAALARAIQAPVADVQARGAGSADAYAGVAVAGAQAPDVASKVQVVLETPVYALIAADLCSGRSVLGAALERLRRHGGMRREPSFTLILLECVLAYLSPADTVNVLEALREQFANHPALLVCYDPIGLDDAFGRHMQQRLEERGAPLQGLNCRATLDEAVRNFESLFAPGAASKHPGRGMDMMEVYQRLRDDVCERSRIERIVALDEVEELRLLMRHYGLIWVSNEHAEVFDFFKPSRFQGSAVDA